MCLSLISGQNLKNFVHMALKTLLTDKIRSLKTMRIKYISINHDFVLFVIEKIRQNFHYNLILYKFVKIQNKRLTPY